MKTNIYIKMLADIDKPQIIAKGEWIDLRCAEDTEISNNGVTNIPLGVAIKLPKGFEAIVVSRSSTPKKQHITSPNAIGVIDSSYCGDKDQWQFIVTPINRMQHPRFKNSKKIIVKKNERIAQFRIQPSQKASMMDKLKWLLSSGINLVFVDHLGGVNRGGIGSTTESDFIANKQEERV